MARIVLGFALFSTLLAVGTACPCVRHSLLDNFCKSAAVFRGWSNRPTDGGFWYQYATIRISDVYRDEADRVSNEHSVVVQTPIERSMCGFEFIAGLDYVVFAYLQKGYLTTDICTSTSLVGDLGEDAMLAMSSGQAQQWCQNQM